MGDTQCHRERKAAFGEFPLPRPSQGFTSVFDCEATNNVQIALNYRKIAIITNTWSKISLIRGSVSSTCWFKVAL